LAAGCSFPRRASVAACAPRPPSAASDTDAPRAGTLENRGRRGSESGTEPVAHDNTATDEAPFASERVWPDVGLAPTEALSARACEPVASAADVDPASRPLTG